MNVQQAKLYQLIQEFSLDDSDAVLPFSKRLARDNGWTAKYTQQVIDEYKKFVFLAVEAEHPVSPSERVDRVVLRSRYGDRVLADLYARHAGLNQTTKNSTMADSQLLLAFALFGTGVLTGSSLTDLRHALIPPPSFTSDSGGGGGCGGCGG